METAKYLDSILSVFTQVSLHADLSSVARFSQYFEIFYMKKVVLSWLYFQCFNKYFIKKTKMNKGQKYHFFVPYVLTFSKQKVEQVSDPILDYVSQDQMKSAYLFLIFSFQVLM